MVREVEHVGFQFYDVRNTDTDTIEHHCAVFVRYAGMRQSYVYYVRADNELRAWKEVLKAQKEQHHEV